MRCILLPLALAAVSPVCGYAQTLTTLQAMDTLPTREFAHGVSEPIKCDGNGNIYFRTASGALPPRAPLVRISSDGQTATRIEFAQGDNEKSEMSDFAVSPDGTLFGILRNHNKSYLVEFDENGSTKHTTEILSPLGTIVIRNLAAFSPETFLVSGNLWDQNRQGRSITAMLSGDGHIGSEVKLKNDVDPTREATDTPLYGPSWVADDGNAYVLRTPSSGARFFVVSASGQFVRTISISSPTTGALASTFGVSHGKLMVYFSKPQKDAPDQVWLKVVNSVSGEEIATYEPGDDLKGVFACYSSDVFEFLVGNADRKFNLVRARAQ